MLGDAGGLPADRHQIEVGGRVLLKEFPSRQTWHVVVRVNHVAGRINSLRTTRRYVPVVGIEEVLDYRAPEGDDASKVKAATAKPPMCNFPAAGSVELTRAQWKRVHPDFRSTRIAAATADHGAYRYRTTLAGPGRGTAPVFITDSERVEPPAPAAAAAEHPSMPEPQPAAFAPKSNKSTGADVQRKPYEEIRGAHVGPGGSAAGPSDP